MVVYTCSHMSGLLLLLSFQWYITPTVFSVGILNLESTNKHISVTIHLVQLFWWYMYFKLTTF